MVRSQSRGHSGLPTARTGGPSMSAPEGQKSVSALPPILAGASTPQVASRVQEFYGSAASIFESWVNRRESPHTRRAYREDVMSFVQFMELRWPEDAMALLRVSIADVLEYRGLLIEQDAAPKTINRRVSSLSSFYKYLGGAAAEMRLPLVVPNPAHSQFIARSATDARVETQSLSATRARQLLSMPEGEGLLAYRDRAILKTFLYTGARLGTVCRLKLSDFHQDGDEYTLRLHEKGNRRRTIGIHFVAGQAIQEYIERAGLTGGILFRPRTSSKGNRLAGRRMDEGTMWRLVLGYLNRLPGSKVERGLNGNKKPRSVYTPHSLRATTATLLLNAGEDITKVQGLLGHRHITTTQIYDKRRRSTSESASHNLQL